MELSRTRHPRLQRQAASEILVVQGFGLALNALFTWIVTGLMHQQPWVALIPVVTITPIATFALNRQWVFG